RLRAPPEVEARRERDGLELRPERDAPARVRRQRLEQRDRALRRLERLLAPAGVAAQEVRVLEPEIGLLGVLRDRLAEEAEVALDLALLRDRAGRVSGVADPHVGEQREAPPLARGDALEVGQHLLVDREAEADLGRAPPEADHAPLQVVVATEVGADRHEPRDVAGALEQLAQPGRVGALELLVGVEQQDEAAARPLEPEVARRGEVVVPCPLDDGRTGGAGDRDAVVARAGVDHHDLVGDGTGARQGAAQRLAAVADDHAERDERRLLHATAHATKAMPRTSRASGGASAATSEAGSREARNPFRFFPGPPPAKGRKRPKGLLTRFRTFSGAAPPRRSCTRLEGVEPWGSAPSTTPTTTSTSTSAPTTRACSTPSKRRRSSTSTRSPIRRRSIRSSTRTTRSAPRSRSRTSCSPPSPTCRSPSPPRPAAAARLASRARCGSSASPSPRSSP